MTSNFRVVPKMENNRAALFMVLPNGEGRQIAYIEFPNDRQIPDNVEAITEIANILRKRIKKSV